jgi:hypothetical protein
MSGSQTIVQAQLLVQDGSGSVSIPGIKRTKAEIALVNSSGVPVIDVNGNMIIIDQVYDANACFYLQEIASNTSGGGGGGGGGGAVTAAIGSYADGAITTMGTKADAAWTGSGSATLIALLKALYAAEVANSTVSLGAGSNAIGSVAVSNFPSTQPISGNVGVSSLPALPAGSNAIGSVTANQGSPGGSAWSVSDPNNAPFANAIAITPGNTFTAGRSIAFVVTVAGNITLTFGSGNTMTFPVVASAALQTLPFAATQLTLGTGTSGNFWNLP